MHGWEFLILLIPLSVTLVEQIKRLRKTREWRRVAVELELSAEGTYPELSMSGIRKGIQVTVHHLVEYRYKQEPIINYRASAKLPLEEDERRNSSTAPRQGMDHEELADTTFADGWIHIDRVGEAQPSELRVLFDRLVYSARRHTIKKPS